MCGLDLRLVPFKPCFSNNHTSKQEEDNVNQIETIENEWLQHAMDEYHCRNQRQNAIRDICISGAKQDEAIFC